MILTERQIGLTSNVGRLQLPRDFSPLHMRAGNLWVAGPEAAVPTHRLLKSAQARSSTSRAPNGAGKPTHGPEISKASPSNAAEGEVLVFRSRIDPRAREQAAQRPASSCACNPTLPEKIKVRRSYRLFRFFSFPARCDAAFLPAEKALITKEHGMLFPIVAPSGTP